MTWYVAGGWAIDLYLGRKTRDHEDIEIAIPRTQFPALRRCLAGFELYQALDGAVTPVGSGEPEAHQVWVCDPAVRVWRMDTFLEPGDAQTWVSHRDERVRLDRGEAVSRDADGIPYLRPQYVLLAKARHTRDKDEADLASVLPTLDGEVRAWLAEAIERVHPGHPWVARVSEGTPS